MSGINELKARIDFNTSPATRALNELSANLVKVSTNSRATATQIRAAATASAQAATALQKESAATLNLAKASETLRKSEDARRLNNAKVAGVTTGTADKSAESAGRQALADSKLQTEEVRRRIALENQAYTREQREIAAANKLRNEALKIEAAKQRAIDQQYSALASTRYALYDVARYAGIAGTALAGAIAAPVATAVSWEKAFAEVIRTTQVTGHEVQDLQNDFVELAQTIPETFEDLTQIGALAGQLGIAKSEITDFTEIVAKFSATAENVSVEDAATAFGRLNSLLPDVNGNFEGIADSILNVGVNSLATESSIVRIATQISALGSQAGFSYDEVIGLSGALASVAVPPELSRGVVTRVFGTISRAIADGGANLERFGRLSGMSGAEFKKAWSKDAGGTFIQFMQGIQSEGGNAEAAIRALGITSVRDVPILIRLANAADSAGKAGGLMSQTFRDAAKASGTLEDQYAIKMNTVSAKLQLLQNNIQAFLNTLGSGTLGPIKGILDYLTEKLKEIQDFTSTPIGGTIAGITLALTALGAILLTIVTASALAFAGLAAVITAMRGLQASAGGASLSLGTMLGLLEATGPAGARAAKTIGLVGKAMKALSLITVVLVLPDLAQWAADAAYSLSGFDTSVKKTAARVKEDFKDGFFGSFQTKDLDEFGASVMRFFAGFDAHGVKDLQKTDEAIAALANSGNIKEATRQLKEQRDAFVESGGKLPAFNALFVDSTKALGDVGDAASGAAEGVDELSEADTEAAQAHQDYLDVLAGGAESFVSLSGALDETIQKQKDMAQATADSTEDAGDSWEDYYDGVSFNLDQYLASLQEQVDAQTAWEANMSSLAGRVSDETLAALAEMGVQAAPLVAKLAEASAPELQKFEDLFSQSGSDAALGFAVELERKQQTVKNAMAHLGTDAQTAMIEALKAGTPIADVMAQFNLDAAGNPIKVQADDSAARGNVTAFIRWTDAQAASIRIRAQITAYGNAAVVAALNGAGYSTTGPADTRINVGMYASGGEVSGPGTGTSDSVPARLSNGEFVMTAAATKALGPDFLYSLMHGAQRGYATGGYVTSNQSANGYTPSYGRASSSGGGWEASDLSNLTRAVATALAQADLRLYTSDRLVASSSNKGATQLARQGTN